MTEATYESVVKDFDSLDANDQRLVAQAIKFRLTPKPVFVSVGERVVFKGLRSCNGFTGTVRKIGRTRYHVAVDQRGGALLTVPMTCVEKIDTPAPPNIFAGSLCTPVL